MRDLINDPGGVGGPPDRFSSEERDRRGAEIASGSRVADQRRDELRPPGSTERVSVVDRIAQAEEDRLVCERFETMTFDRCDEEVDRVRAEVDGRCDGPERVRPVQCRYLNRRRGASSGWSWSGVSHRPTPIAEWSWRPSLACAGSPASPPGLSMPRLSPPGTSRRRAWRHFWGLRASPPAAWVCSTLPRTIGIATSSPGALAASPRRAQQVPRRTQAMRAARPAARRARPGAPGDPGPRPRPRQPASDASPPRPKPSGAASRASLSPSAQRPRCPLTRPNGPFRTSPLDLLPHPRSCAGTAHAAPSLPPFASSAASITAR